MRSPLTATKSSPHSPQLKKARMQQQNKKNKVIHVSLKQEMVQHFSAGGCIRTICRPFSSEPCLLPAFIHPQDREKASPILVTQGEPGRRHTKRCVRQSTQAGSSLNPRFHHPFCPPPSPVLLLLQRFSKCDSDQQH